MCILVSLWKFTSGSFYFFCEIGNKGVSEEGKSSSKSEM